MYALIVLKVHVFMMIFNHYLLLILLLILDSHAGTDTKASKFEEAEQTTGTVRIHFNFASMRYIVSQLNAVRYTFV